MTQSVRRERSSVRPVRGESDAPVSTSPDGSAPRRLVVARPRADAWPGTPGGPSRGSRPMFAFLLAVAVTAQLLAGSTTALANNLIVNGDFSAGFNSFWGGMYPQNWGAAWRGAFDAAIWDDHSMADEHGPVLRMSSLAGGFEAGIIQVVYGLTPGELFSVSAQAFQTGTGTTAWLAVDMEGGTALPTRDVQFDNVPNQWNYKQIVASAGPAGKVSVFLWAYHQSSASDVYFDNVRLTLGTSNSETPGEIAGYVTSTAGGAIANARVQTATGGYSTLTASDGSYSLSGMEPGTYDVSVAANGYYREDFTDISVEAWQTTPLNAQLTPMPVSDQFVTIEGDQFVWGGQVVKIKGTNYYPREHMWAKLWSDFDWGDMTREIPMLRGLGLNCVRLLVPYSKGGWSSNPSEEKLSQLEDLVNLCGENGIRSCVTLFDWETSFPPAGLDGSHNNYVDAIVGRLKDNPHVLCWDVKNEPDHPANLGEWMDNWDTSTRKAQIVSWLERMCDRVRLNDPNHPVSAGIRWWENVDDVIDFVDIAIFHSYWPNIGTEEIPDVKRYMGANPKPILVEEWGWPSHPTPCNRDGNLIWLYNETEQLSVYVNHLNAFREHDIAGGIQWMTFDQRDYSYDRDDSFENWFGLWYYDETLKPAGRFYRDNMPVTQFFTPADAAPGPVTGFTAERIGDTIHLSWTNPTDADFARTLVRYSPVSHMSVPTAGTLACESTGIPGGAGTCTFGPISEEGGYFFSAFAFDLADQYSAAAHATATVAFEHPGDLDGDDDVDHNDLYWFKLCRSGEGIPHVGSDCDDADLDHDTDVDMSDFGIFQRCLSGRDVPSDPFCAD